MYTLFVLFLYILICIIKIHLNTDNHADIKIEHNYSSRMCPRATLHIHSYKLEAKYRPTWHIQNSLMFLNITELHNSMYIYLQYRKQKICYQTFSSVTQI